MRWTVFAIFAFLFLVFEVSVRQVLELRSLASISPSFVIVLVVYVAFFAPRRVALWAAWLLGLVYDLCVDLPHGMHDAGPLIGAHALGFTFGAYLIIQVRAMLYRTSVVALAVMSIACTIAASLVVVFLYSVHGWYPGSDDRLHWADLRPSGELTRRAGIAVYTGLVALALARPLVWAMPIWGFRSSMPRR